MEEQKHAKILPYKSETNLGDQMVIDALRK